MDPTEQAKRVAWYELATELHERTGVPLERCLLAVQQQEIRQRQQEQDLQRILTWFREEYLPAFVTAVEGLIERFMPSIEAIQNLLDQIGTPLRQPLCPKHGQVLKGGRCSVCDRRGGGYRGHGKHRGF